MGLRQAPPPRSQLLARTPVLAGHSLQGQVDCAPTPTSPLLWNHGVCGYVCLCSWHTCVKAPAGAGGRGTMCNSWFMMQSPGARRPFAFKSEVCQPLSSVVPLGKFKIYDP